MLARRALLNLSAGCSVTAGNTEEMECNCSRTSIFQKHVYEWTNYTVAILPTMWMVTIVQATCSSKRCIRVQFFTPPWLRKTVTQSDAPCSAAQAPTESRERWTIVQTSHLKQTNAVVPLVIHRRLGYCA